MEYMKVNRPRLAPPCAKDFSRNQMREQGLFVAATCGAGLQGEQTRTLA